MLIPNFDLIYFFAREFSFCTKKKFKHFELLQFIRRNKTNKKKTFTCALSTKRYTNKIIITNHNLSAVIYVKKENKNRKKNRWQTMIEIVVVFYEFRKQSGNTRNWILNMWQIHINSFSIHGLLISTTIISFLKLIQQRIIYLIDILNRDKLIGKLFHWNSEISIVKTNKQTNKAAE